MKTLSLAEEYLEYHFPLFPVMPGVLMLEALYQTSAWLVRQTDEFRHSLVTLQESRNIKFSGFVRPGQVLNIRSEVLKRDERTTTLKAEGRLDGVVAVSGRLILEHYNLADTEPSKRIIDAMLIQNLRKDFDLLYRPTTSEVASA